MLIHCSQDGWPYQGGIVMNIKKLCESCNSPIVKVKKGRKTIVECSYCGRQYEKGVELSNFIPEYDGDDE
jgi:ribosomal protein L37AE/L43A